MMRLKFLYLFITINLLNYSSQNEITVEEKRQLKDKVLEMFDHAFSSYMKYAYPADELMPLSCQGRYRNSHASRGDIDEVLGNYTLTLVDTLDTLALLGRIEDFEQAVKNVIKHTKFDNDLVVSVFESNIRMLGGLISGHVSVIYVRNKYRPTGRFDWYNDELLDMAKDLGNRLLPAFNTSTGLPMSRINLKKGITPDLLSSEKDKFTCTACAGTLLLEFVALSRLTGDKVFEEKVKKTMDFIWEKRNKVSDLVGTVINVNDGEWANKDSSIGAGIDSYYEYLFKGYILTGDENLLYRFNRHYDSINKYMSLNTNGHEHEIGDGSCMKTVHMHMPNRQARNYIDALLAFWPGIQVLKGDIKGAIKMHESLNQIVKKHDFLPEAVLFDHSIHWSSHPLRPEFLESTYYLYRATKDDYYLQIAKKMLNQLEKYSRVKCGYAALSDVKTKQHEDRVDSFFYAETFKYLYLIFAEDENNPDSLEIDVNDFLFTTEAHLIPLNMQPYKKKKLRNKSKQKSLYNGMKNKRKSVKYSNITEYDENQVQSLLHKSCPSLKVIFATEFSQLENNDKKNNPFNLTDQTRRLRESVGQSYEEKCMSNKEESATSPQIEITANFNQEKLKSMPLRAADFVVGRKDHLDLLKKMGIHVTTMSDGRIQLVHKSNEAINLRDAEMGIMFMTEMLELSKQQNQKSNVFIDEYKSISVVLISQPFNALTSYPAGPAQFGYDFRTQFGLFGKLLLAQPIDGCGDYTYSQWTDYSDKIIVAKRGSCMFIEKARKAESFGALGIIIIDNSNESSYYTSPLFAMSGDGTNNNSIKIPSLFLFGKEGQKLMDIINMHPDMLVYIGDNSYLNNIHSVHKAILYNTNQLKSILNKKGKDLLFTKAKSFINDIINRNKNPIDLICESNLKFYYELFKSDDVSETEEDKLNAIIDGNKTAELVKTISFDESIKVKILENESKILFINIEFLKGLAKTDDNISLSNKIFEILLERLKEKTNFEQLDNKNLYEQAIYNYINSILLKKSDLLSQNDQLLLEQLAYYLDFKK